MTLIVRLLRSLAGRRGGVDLNSVAIGTVVVGIIATGLVATTVGVVPWSQDRAARQILSQARTAQGLALNSEKTYLSAQELHSKKFLGSTGAFAMEIDYTATGSQAGKCYIAVAASKTGATYFVTNKVSAPTPVTTESIALYASRGDNCRIARATTAAANEAAIKALAVLAGTKL